MPHIMALTDVPREGTLMIIGLTMALLVTHIMAIGQSMDTRIAPRTTWAPTSIITGITPMAVQPLFIIRVELQPMIIPSVKGGLLL